MVKIPLAISFFSSYFPVDLCHLACEGFEGAISVFSALYIRLLLFMCLHCVYNISSAGFSVSQPQPELTSFYLKQQKRSSHLKVLSGFLHISIAFY